jgi:hypothetical protein
VRLAIAALVGSLAASAAFGGPLACSRASVQTRTVTLYAPQACARDATPYTLGASPYALFEPLGDFEPQGPPSSLPLSNKGTVLAGFPSDTREVVATMTGATSAQWAAHAVLAATGGVDLLALPFGSPCALSDPIDARTNAAIGAIDEGHVLVAGGVSPSGVPRTALLDLTRGVVNELAVGLLVPRTNASVTAWSGGAVVAGGVPLEANGPTFELYDASAGDFDGKTYSLSEPRARHGAVVLANGQTLLVGGVDLDGNVLASLEAIDPVAQRARTGGLALLAVPRADPVVLRLASGEILVAGGVDATGLPVSTLEWLTADGSEREKTRELVSAPHESFVALAAGGALAVIAPSVPAAGFQNVWVISADGDFEAATPIDGSLSDARLFAGTEQSPLLWTGDRWLVWQPWAGAFTALAPAIGASGPSAASVASPIASLIVSPEAGLGVWVDATTVHALRSGTRGPYATTPASSPLLLTGTAFTAPDRLATGGAVTFDPTVGATLQPGASVFVTDATFGSFALDADTPGKLPPSIVLRDDAGNETVLDAASCPLAPGNAIHVERDANGVRASVDGGALAPCTAAPASAARVSIGVRGAPPSGASGASGSVIRGLVITRR